MVGITTFFPASSFSVLVVSVDKRVLLIPRGFPSVPGTCVALLGSYLSELSFQILLAAILIDVRALISPASIFLLNSWALSLSDVQTHASFFVQQVFMFGNDF